MKPLAHRMLQILFCCNMNESFAKPDHLLKQGNFILLEFINIYLGLT